MSISYEKLPFDVFCNEPMRKKYIEFERRTVFSIVPQGLRSFSFEDLDKITRFVVLFLDPLSPFFDEQDEQRRIDACMAELKYDDDERFYEEVKGYTRYWQVIIFEYFKMVNNIQYETWLTYKRSFHLISAQLRAADDNHLPIKPNERDRLTKSLLQYQKDILELQAAVFPDARTMRAVSEQATEDLGGYAESHAIEVDFAKIYRSIGF